MERKKARWGWVFVIPSLILFSAFSFFPIMNAFYESFFNRNLLSLRPPRFVGWDNYTYLFRSKDFWLSVQNTLIFTLGTFLPLLVFSLILAVFIMSISVLAIFSDGLHSPAVLSSVVAALIWLLIFDPAVWLTMNECFIGYSRYKLQLAIHNGYAASLYHYCLFLEIYRLLYRDLCFRNWFDPTLWERRP